MSNILISIKKFITNKNVVTVLGVIVILGLLYWGYNSTIEKETKPVRIPVATQTIQPRTKITDDMIEFITVPSASVSENVKRTSSSIIGLYTDVNTVIPAGSMFYTDVLIEEKELPDSAFVEVPEGQRPYALSVTTANTLGNSIFPGNIIDVFMKATDDNGQVMVGRFLQDVEVLAVKDSSGKNVFENTEENRTPATLTFGVPEDIFILLKKAEYLKSLGVELFPAPRGGVPQVDGSITVDRQELVDYINSNTVILSENTTDQTTDPNATTDSVIPQ